MNLNSGVRVLNTQSGAIGNIKSVEGEGDAAVLTCVAQDGSGEFTCAVSDARTLKGRPRKMAV